MLNGSTQDSTVHMEGTKEGWCRGGDGLWPRKTVGDGGAITLGKSTGASGDG